MKRIYVGNLDYGVTENSVRELFAKYGKVDSVAFIRDKESGIFRGFCFVNMEDEDSKRAIEKLNKTTFAGRIIEVMPANMKKRRKKKFEE
ncbi:MAG: RNA-binding protein [Candidatus Mucispirillum faecigallinarum]|uniref:RNA-binding protein n=1 Tax=Candidatus Mucispirillum faecigallinarum TaxID=2838699 RepID=A0A9D2KAN9_9BACT|nr:RNA-binding protein [Mucispirillum sp.]MDY5050119.1 RNA-binding protein [Candidatus Mucispirillum faecigallinarum]HIZ88940.1 RNA-binding protein [Candidatus Mucispirillum faecigallinarum]